MSALTLTDFLLLLATLRGATQPLRYIAFRDENVWLYITRSRDGLGNTYRIAPLMNLYRVVTKGCSGMCLHLFFCSQPFFVFPQTQDYWYF